jgi:hypothetical protein
MLVRFDALASAALASVACCCRAYHLRVNGPRGSFTLEDEVTDIPDNVTLEWLPRPQVEFRQETRTRFDGLERKLQRLHDDFDISAAILRRVDYGQDAYREDIRTLFDAVGGLRRRLDATEREPRD